MAIALEKKNDKNRDRIQEAKEPDMAAQSEVGRK